MFYIYIILFLISFSVFQEEMSLLVPATLSCFIIFLSICETETASYAEIESLFKSNIEGRNINIRPVLDQTNPVRVFLEFKMFYLQAFDEVAGELDVSGYLKVMWKDETIYWDANKTGIASLSFYDDKTIWTPDIIVANSYGGVKHIYQDNTLKRVLSDGNVVWFPTDIFETICIVDTSKFPFDSHTCYIAFQVWGFLPKQEILLNTLQNKVGLDYFFSSRTWVLKKTHVFKLDDLELVVFAIHFERNSAFFIMNLILPIFVLSILNIFAFFLPPESGERVGFSVTVLLAIAVFLTISADKLPATSYPRMPSISILLFADVIVSSIIVLQVILTLRYYHGDERIPVPTSKRIFVKVSKFIRCRSSCRNEHLDKYFQDRHTKDVTWRDVGKEFDIIGAIFTTFIVIIINVLFIVDVTVGLPILNTHFESQLFH